MKREDVLKVDELKTELSSAFRQFEQRLTGVFGELVYAVDTVVDRYNDLDVRYTQLQAEDAKLQRQLDVVSERLLALERVRRGDH